MTLGVELEEVVEGHDAKFGEVAGDELVDIVTREHSPVEDE